jgi:hypothetical protein
MTQTAPDPYQAISALASDRRAAIAQAEFDKSAALVEANRAFVDGLRPILASKETTVEAAARAAGINRQRVHQLLRAYPETTAS